MIEGDKNRRNDKSAEAVSFPSHVMKRRIVKSAQKAFTPKRITETVKHAPLQQRAMHNQICVSSPLLEYRSKMHLHARSRFLNARDIAHLNAHRVAK